MITTTTTTRTTIIITVINILVASYTIGILITLSKALVVLRFKFIILSSLLI